MQRALIHEGEIVRRELWFTVPSKAQPGHVLTNRVDVFLIFLGRIRIVEAEVAVPGEGTRQTEVKADRLRMPDVQVTVRLRRETSDNGLVFSLLQVLLDDIADEIPLRHCV